MICHSHVGENSLNALPQVDCEPLLIVPSVAVVGAQAAHEHEWLGNSAALERQKERDLLCAATALGLGSLETREL